eukprot:TRINITY_DN109343_c0_g1_i1.p1 TRINITY_DN109343_c0_g1~~TRINITY_DN109343_c0_g1_i1.p1  ORF type:complete len:132 (-),score=28.44 TRINITY_DN109343_c0_g1_i1:40-435(-)
MFLFSACCCVDETKPGSAVEILDGSEYQESERISGDVQGAQSITSSGSQVPLSKECPTTPKVSASTEAGSDQELPVDSKTPPHLDEIPQKLAQDDALPMSTSAAMAITRSSTAKFRTSTTGALPAIDEIEE